MTKEEILNLSPWLRAPQFNLARKLEWRFKVLKFCETLETNPLRRKFIEWIVRKALWGLDLGMWDWLG